MHNEGRPQRTRRKRWGIGATAAVVLAVLAALLIPRGLRGPERIAIDFIEISIHAPQDEARLRTAARIGDTEDPRALLQGLSTGVALGFLHARQTQGNAQSISVLNREQPAPHRYVLTLRVSEGGIGAAASSRDFVVQLQEADGGWRLSSVRLVD
jgi:hypothetical protein